MSFTGVTTLQSAAAANANGSALPVSGMAVVAFQVTGTFVGQLVFEASLDATNYVALQVVANTGIFLVPCAGAKFVRARVVWTSGTSVTVVAQAISDGDVAARLTIPGARFAAITKSDTVNLTYVTRGIYVGVGGDISAEGAISGTAVVFKGAVAGSVLPLQVTRVNSTATTATDLVGLY